MIKSLVEQLVENQYRWLIVTGVTFVIALASLAPRVDQLLREHSELAELQAQLAQASEADRRLPRYRQRVEDERVALELLQARQVGDSGVKSLRSWLVDSARESGCRVRRLDLTDPSTRAWGKNDNPLDTPEDSNKKTPYQLQTRIVTLRVTGTEAELHTLLRVLDEDGRLKHTRSLELSQAGRKPSDMQLDLTLWYFALAESNNVT